MYAELNCFYIIFFSSVELGMNIYTVQFIRICITDQR